MAQPWFIQVYVRGHDRRDVTEPSVNGLTQHPTRPCNKNPSVIRDIHVDASGRVGPERMRRGSLFAVMS